MKIAEIADQQGGSLKSARSLTDEEKLGYAGWCKNRMFIAVGESVEVGTQSIREVVGDRPSDGELPGYSNSFGWSQDVDS